MSKAKSGSVRLILLNVNKELQIILLHLGLHKKLHSFGKLSLNVQISAILFYTRLMDVITLID